MALCAFSLCSIATYAQQDRNVVFHMSDKTTKTVSLAGVDSLTFEKAVRTPLNLDLEIHSTYIKEIMTCSDPNMSYYVSYLEKELFDEYYPTDDKLIAEDKQWIEEMAKSYDSSVADMVKSWTYQGNNDEYQANLLPGHEYVVWMHGMDENANSTTPVTKIVFRAKDVDRIANIVTLTAEKTADGIYVEAKPDDKTKNYTLGFFPTSKMRDEMTCMPQGTLDYIDHGVIAGVSEDYSYTGVFEESLPLIMLHRNLFQFCLMVRIDDSRADEAVLELNEAWAEVFPDRQGDFVPLGDIYSSMYRNELNARNLVLVFTLLCFVMADLGLIVFMAFIIRRRTKEIAVRKINGATAGTIVRLLNVNFIRYIAIAFVVAVPVSWLVLHSWLQRFAYRTSLDWWLFAASGAAVFLISMLSISLQSWRAATVNPANGLRK